MHETACCIDGVGLKQHKVAERARHKGYNNVLVPARLWIDVARCLRYRVAHIRRCPAQRHNVAAPSIGGSS